MFSVLYQSWATYNQHTIHTGNFSPHQEDPLNVSQLPLPAREAIVKFLIDQNITIRADGTFSREGLCNDTGNGNESLAASVNELLCGSRIQCPSEFHRYNNNTI